MNSRLSLSRAIASLAVFPVAVAMAASDATTVVVTGTRIPTPLPRVVADVVVIDSDQIRNAVGGSLEELLREHAGLQISRNGGPGQSAAAFIRGAGAANTVVLVDGVRIGSATLGQVSLEGLSLAQIERIEVLRGPGSSLYGADAVGGVVQIFTRRGEGAVRLQAFAAAGGDRSSELQARVSGASGAFDYALSASREASDGVSAVAEPGGAFGSYNPDEDGFKRGGGSLQLGFTPVQGQRIGVQWLESRLNAQFDSAEFAPPTFAPDPSPDFRNHLVTRTLALDWRAQFSSAWRSDLTLAQSDDRLRSGANVIDRFDTRRRQVGWQNSWALAPDHTLVGLVEHLEEQVDATPLGAAPLTRDNDALAVSYSGAAGAHRWQADLRQDHNSVYDDQTTGKLGYGFQILEQWSVRASAGTAFRAPSFNELYFPGFGVATIRPEKSTSVEFGTAWREAAWSAQATLYRNRVRDLIVFEFDPTLCPPGYAFGCARNAARATLQGASLVAQGVQGAWHWSAGAEFLQARDDETGQRLNRRAAHTANASLGYDVHTWALRASLQAVGARPDGGTRMPAYELLDLGGHWRVAPRWRFEAKLLNALDKSYQPVKDYGAPGRQFWLGLRYDSAGF
jgi:vitamin B12 transporter